LGKQEEIEGKWTKFLSEGFHNFLSSLNIIRISISRRRMKDGGTCGAVTNTYRISVENLERKKSFGRIDLTKKKTNEKRDKYPTLVITTNYTNICHKELMIKIYIPPTFSAVQWL
jgi:hypothetical protein